MDYSVYDLKNTRIVELENGGDRVAFGKVYSHPKFRDGTNIRTSLIQSIDGNIITTLNNKYRMVD